MKDYIPASEMKHLFPGTTDQTSAFSLADLLGRRLQKNLHPAAMGVGSR